MLRVARPLPSFESFPEEMLYSFRDAFAQRIAKFANDYFIQLSFIFCSILSILCASRHVLIGAFIAHHTNSCSPNDPGENDPVITVLHTALAVISALSSFLSCFIPNPGWALHGSLLLSGWLIYNVGDRFGNKYLCCI